MNFIDATSSNNFIITIASFDVSFSINTIGNTTNCYCSLTNNGVMTIASINFSIIENTIGGGFVSRTASITCNRVLAPFCRDKSVFIILDTGSNTTFANAIGAATAITASTSAGDRVFSAASI